MNDNKAFAAWVLLVVGGAATLLLTMVVTGFVALPPIANILADVALGLSVRAAYKWTGGWNWADWSFGGDARETVVAAGEMPAAEPLRKAA